MRRNVERRNQIHFEFKLTAYISNGFSLFGMSGGIRGSLFGTPYSIFNLIGGGSV